MKKIKKNTVKTEPKSQPEPKNIKICSDKASEVVLKAIAEIGDAEVAKAILELVNADNDLGTRTILNLGALELCRVALAKKYKCTFVLAISNRIILTNV